MGYKVGETLTVGTDAAHPSATESRLTAAAIVGTEGNGYDAGRRSPSELTRRSPSRRSRTCSRASPSPPEDNYRDSDALTVGDASFTVASTHAICDSAEVVAAGSGYADNETVTIGTDATGTLTCESTLDSITSITAKGSNYQMNDLLTVGTDAKIVVSGVQDTCTGMQVTSKGEGYAVGDQLKVSDATAYVRAVEDTLEHVKILNGGSGFSVNDTLTGHNMDVNLTVARITDVNNIANVSISATDTTSTSSGSVRLTDGTDKTRVNITTKGELDTASLTTTASERGSGYSANQIVGVVDTDADLKITSVHTFATGTNDATIIKYGASADSQNNITFTQAGVAAHTFAVNSDTSEATANAASSVDNKTDFTAGTAATVSTSTSSVMALGSNRVPMSANATSGSNTISVGTGQQVDLPWDSSSPGLVDSELDLHY